MKKYQKITQIIFLLAILLISLISPLQSTQAQSTEVLPSGLPVSQLATAIEDHVQENQATTAGMAVGVFDGDEICTKIILVLRTRLRTYTLTLILSSSGAV